MNTKVFISGALTAISDSERVKADYERIADLCEVHGLTPYVPHRYTDPVINSDVSSQRVYELDSYHVRTARLVIAYVGIPSLGVGQEVEIARQSDVPVILLYEREHPVSRMTRGCPGVVAEIPFDSFDEALSQISALLQNLPLAREMKKAEGMLS